MNDWTSVDDDSTRLDSRNRRTSMWSRLAVVAGAAHAAFVQKEFVISFWVDPIVDPSEFGAAYALVAAANFTTIMGGFGAVQPAAVSAQIQAAASVGLTVIPSTCETAQGPGPNGTCVGLSAPPGTVLGYQMWDEPAESDFPTVAKWMASVRARAPDALRFVNLLPNYGFPGPHSSPVYEQYVSAFVAATQPDILCFDHYPLFGPPGHGQPAGSDDDNAQGNHDGRDDVSMAGYHRNLAIIRANALAQSPPIPFWNFFASMPFNGRPDMSEAQMRWQAFTSLAYGARGLLYFCLWSPTGSPFVWSGAVLTPIVPLADPSAPPTYVPGIHYDHATRINTKLRVLGGWLMQATSTSVLLASGNGTEAVAVPGAAVPLASVAGSGAGPSWAALVGFFSLSSQLWTAAALVHNQDPSAPAILTLVGTNASAPVWEIDASTGQPRGAVDDAPSLPGWQVSLDAGDARLFVW